MTAEETRKKLIHIVMQEAYEEGYAEGRRQAYEEIKWMKECKHKERMEKDFFTSSAGKHLCETAVERRPDVYI